MKKIIFSLLSMVILTMAFTACDDTYEDFMTGDVETGGLVSPLKSFPYKLGGTTDFAITVDVPVGPGIKSVEVYKTYTDKPEILDRTIDVSSANTSGIVNLSIPYNYASLTDGLSMPADESELNIGDEWTLSYVSIMEDSRSVMNATKTSIGVANFFAGTYSSTVNYHHPSRGDYPDNGSISSYDKILKATNANTCETAFAVWSDKCWITVNADNSITFVVDDTWDYDVTLGVPDHPELVSYYEPATGLIQLYYNYLGGSGYRIFHETFVLP